MTYKCPHCCHDLLTGHQTEASVNHFNFGRLMLIAVSAAVLAACGSPPLRNPGLAHLADRLH